MTSKYQLAHMIVADPDILAGKPSVEGTRISVELIMRELSMGVTPAELIQSYPTLTDEGIRAACAYCAAMVASEHIIIAAE